MPAVVAEASRQDLGGGDEVKPRGGQRRPPRRALLGQLLVRERLITPAQLQDALRVQAETATYAPLGQILVEQRIITQAQLAAVLDRYKKKSRLGDILVETRTITEEQLELALECQEGTGRRLGDILVRLNFATEIQIKQALARQLEITFVELDTVAIDRRLTNLIRRDYAAERRVIPIAMTEDRITLAMDDPTDTDVIEELELCTSCRVDVVTSTSAEFERAFARAYDEASEEEAPGDAGSSAADLETAETGGEDLMRWGAPDSPAWTDLRAECEALREERDAAERARRDLEVRHAEATRRLAELEGAYEALRQEHAAALEALRRRAGESDLPPDLDRQRAADTLEAILRRLKA